MLPAAFVDTNIWIYAYDDRDMAKQRLAQELIDAILCSQSMVVSTQVVQEFTNVMKTKLRVADVELLSVLDTVLGPLVQHAPTLDFYTRAVQLLTKYSLNFYDALIVQAALDLHCDVLYSEDLQDGQQFNDLTVRNPFAAKASWK